MIRRPLVAAAIVVTATCAVGSTAFAGEVGGSGQPLPLSGNSFCKYSGQNDTPDDPEEGGRVQSWGQFVRVVGYAQAVEIAQSFGEDAPGVACNGHLNPAPKGPLHP